MVRVPLVSEDRRRRSVAPGTKFSASPDLEVFGAGASSRGVSQGVNKLIASVGSIFQKEQDSADQAALLEAQDKISKFEIDSINSRRDRKGKDSFSLPEEEEEVKSVRYQEIIDEAPNDRVREKIRPLTLRSNIALRKFANVYVNGEIESYKKEQYQSSVANERQAALLTNDPERIASANEFIRIAAESRADDQGLSLIHI